MHSKETAIIRILTLAAAAALGISTHAGTVTWDGGTAGTGTSWNDPVNWVGDALPASGDTAVFTNNGGTGVSVTKTIALDAPQSIYQLTIPDWSNVPAFTIGSAADASSGNTLTLTKILRGDNMSNTQTVAANVTLAADGLITVYKGYNGGLAITGSISGAGRGLTAMLPNGGTLTFSGANTYTGPTTLNAGTLTLSFATNSTNILSSASSLVMGGGGLALTGKASTTNSQTVNGLTVNPGASSLSISNSATANPTLLALGAITRNIGGTINFSQPSNGAVSATNGYTTSASNDAAGILGAYATVGGSNWASNNGTNVVALASYTNNAWAVGNNTDVTADATIADASETHSLRFAGAAARTLTLGGNATLTSGGILVTSAVGANATTITGGALKSAGGELVIHQNNNNASGAVTIASAIADGSSATTLTKSGSGVLNLTGTLSYTGGTHVNAGTMNLVAGSTNPLSTSGKVVVSGGTLALGTGTSQTTSGDVVIRGGTLSGGTLTKTGGNYDGQAGTVSSVLAGSVGMQKIGPGTLALTGANTYTGDTVVLEGKLTASSSGSIKGNLIVGSVSGGPDAYYSQSNTPFTSTKNVTVYSNGLADFGSSAQHLSGTVNVLGGTITGGQIYQNVTVSLTGGTWAGTSWGNSNSFTTLASPKTSVISASLQSAQSTKTFTVADGAAPTDLLLSGSVASGAVTKAGPGLMLVTGNNGYTGVTSVTGGTLVVGPTGNINTTGGITLSNDATLRYEAATALTKPLTLNGTSTLVYNSSAKLGNAIAIGTGRTLSGCGTLAGVTVNGLLKPGNSPGQITMDSLALGSTATTTMEIGGATLGTQYDNINIVNSAGLTYGGTLDVVAYGGFDLAQAGSYTLFTFSGSESGDLAAVSVGGNSLTNDAGIWSGTFGAATYIFTESNGTLAVTIPEPGTIALAAGVTLLGLTRRQRAKR